MTVNVYGAMSWLSRDVPKFIGGGFFVRSFAGASLVTVFVATYGGLCTLLQFMLAALAVGTKNINWDVPMTTSAAVNRKQRAAAPDRDLIRVTAGDI